MEPSRTTVKVHLEREKVKGTERDIIAKIMVDDEIYTDRQADTLALLGCLVRATLDGTWLTTAKALMNVKDVERPMKGARPIDRVRWINGGSQMRARFSDLRKKHNGLLVGNPIKNGGHRLDAEIEIVRDDVQIGNS